MSNVTVRARIRNLAVGGAGVGNVIAVETAPGAPADESLQGITAFVPFTIPGEEVRAFVEAHKKRYLEARLAEVLLPAPGRVVPQCEHFGVCGGCELQHMSYPTQLETKGEMIRSMLQVGGLGPEVISTLRPIVPSSPFNYRRRISLHIDEQGQIGFYRSRSREVVSLRECPISSPQIEELLPRLGSFAQAVARKVSTLVLEADDRGVCAAMRGVSSLYEADIEAVIDAARAVFDGAILTDDSGERAAFGRRELSMPSIDGPVTVPLGAFSQVNAEINGQLIATVCDQLESRTATTVWDLYAGAGNFALPLKRRGFDVLAVEVDERLVEVGKQGLASYLCSSVERFLKSAAAAKLPDAIVADPPRSGLGALVSTLPKVDTLILISCHLPSFVRDLKGLLQQGWKVSRILPFDMFAQTSYVEVLSVFQKK